MPDVAADRVLGSALGLALQPQAAGVTASCEPVVVDGLRTLSVPAGQAGVVLELVRDGPIAVDMRRFSVESFPIELGTLAPGRVYALELPLDRSAEPWELQLSGSGSVRACWR